MSSNTCYYSENQIFDFLKSRILTCRIFFLGTKLFCLLSESAEILWGFMKSWILTAHLDNFYFLTPHVTNRDVLLLATIRYVLHNGVSHEVTVFQGTVLEEAPLCNDWQRLVLQALRNGQVCLCNHILSTAVSICCSLYNRVSSRTDLWNWQVT